jgi:hypothetical protein
MAPIALPLVCPLSPSCGFISVSLLGFHVVVESKWVLDVHVLASLPEFSCHDDQFAVMLTFQFDVKESFLSS